MADYQLDIGADVKPALEKIQELERKLTTGPAIAVPITVSGGAVQQLTSIQTAINGVATAFNSIKNLKVGDFKAKGGVFDISERGARVSAKKAIAAVKKEFATANITAEVKYSTAGAKIAAKEGLVQIKDVFAVNPVEVQTKIRPATKATATRAFKDKNYVAPVKVDLISPTQREVNQKLAEISALLEGNDSSKVRIKYDNSDLDRVKTEFNNWAVSEKIVYFDFKPRNDPGDFVTATPRPGGSPGGPSGSVRSFVSGPGTSVTNDVLSSVNEARAAGLTDRAAEKIGESIGARLNERLSAARGQDAYITVDALRKLLGRLVALSLVRQIESLW